jgi:hypothetical protein
MPVLVGTRTAVLLATGADGDAVAAGLGAALLDAALAVRSAPSGSATTTATSAATPSTATMIAPKTRPDLPLTAPTLPTRTDSAARRRPLGAASAGRGFGATNPPEIKAGHQGRTSKPDIKARHKGAGHKKAALL